MFDKEDTQLLNKEYRKFSTYDLAKESNRIDYELIHLVKKKNLKEFNEYFMDLVYIQQVVSKLLKKRYERAVDKERNFLIKEFGSMSLEKLFEEKEALGYHIMALIKKRDIDEFNKYFMPSLRESGLINTFIKDKQTMNKLREFI